MEMSRNLILTLNLGRYRTEKWMDGWMDVRPSLHMVTVRCSLISPTYTKRPSELQSPEGHNPEGCDISFHI